MPVICCHRGHPHLWTSYSHSHRYHNTLKHTHSFTFELIFMITQLCSSQGTQRMGEPRRARWFPSTSSQQGRCVWTTKRNFLPWAFANHSKSKRRCCTPSVWGCLVPLSTSIQIKCDLLFLTKPTPACSGLMMESSSQYCILPGPNVAVESHHKLNMLFLTQHKWQISLQTLLLWNMKSFSIYFSGITLYLDWNNATLMLVFSLKKRC